LLLQLIVTPDSDPVTEAAGTLVSPDPLPVNVVAVTAAGVTLPIAPGEAQLT
jgi:hypothetical protein